MAITIN